MGVNSSRIVAGHVLAACDRSDGDSVSPSEMDNPEFTQALHSVLSGSMPLNVEAVLSQYGFRRSAFFENLQLSHALDTWKAAPSILVEELASEKAPPDFICRLYERINLLSTGQMSAVDTVKRRLYSRAFSRAKLTFSRLFHAQGNVDPLAEFLVHSGMGSNRTVRKNCVEWAMRGKRLDQLSTDLEHPGILLLDSNLSSFDIERGKDLSTIKAAASNALPQLAEVVARYDEASSALFSPLEAAISNWEYHMQSMHQLACPKRPSDRIHVAKLCSLVTGNTQLCDPHTTTLAQTRSGVNATPPMTIYTTLQNPRHTHGMDMYGLVVQANPLHDNGLQEQPEIREWGDIPYMPHPVNYQ